jgi:hypothetical protein
MSKPQMGPNARSAYSALTWYLDEIRLLVKEAQENTVKNPGRSLDATARALVYLGELGSLVTSQIEPLMQRKAARQDAEQVIAELLDRVAGLEGQLGEVLRRLPSGAAPPANIVQLHRLAE